VVHAERCLPATSDYIMWPFRRRKPHRGDELDLEEMRKVGESSPARRYGNLLLLEMVRNGPAERTLRRSRPLPWPAHFGDEELPPFTAVLNRFKVMSCLDPVTYHEPREARFSIMVRIDDRMQEVIVHTRFNDSRDDPSVHLRMDLADTGPSKQQNHRTG